MKKVSRTIRLVLLCWIGLVTLPTHAQDLQWPTNDQVQRLQRVAIDVLGSILRDPQSKDTDRLSGVNALIQSGDQDAVPLLAEVLLSDPAPFVRRAAAEGFSRLPVGEAAPALRQAALTDSIASIRWASGVALVRWRLAESEVIARLLSDPRTLAAAAISLQETASANAFPRALWLFAESAMTMAFPDRVTYNLVERAAMLKALAQMNAQSEIPLLWQTLNASDEDPFVRGAAAFGLGMLAVREAVPDLIAALESDAEALQLAAAGALARLSDERALEPLRAILHDADSPEVRSAAATALSSFGAAVVPTLTQALLSDENPSVRQAALRGLAYIGGSEATQAVLSFLGSGFLLTCEPSVCSGLALETLVALAKLDQGALAVQLLERTLDAVRDVLPLFFAFAEQALVNVVTQVGRVAPQVFDLLLQDESTYVQALGLTALANVQGRASREALLCCLDPDESVIVRRAVLEGLSKWATSDDLAILILEITNRDRRSRVAALSALARVGDARALQPLSDALNSEILVIRLDVAGAALRFSHRMAELNAALNCERRNYSLPDRVLVCLER